MPSISGIAEGTVARFNYSDPVERDKAALHRLNEVPFILTNVPDISDASKRWTVSECWYCIVLCTITTLIARVFDNKVWRIEASSDVLCVESLHGQPVDCHHASPAHTKHQYYNKKIANKDKSYV